MPAFLVVDIEVTDQKRFEEYKRAVPASLSAYGGKYLARGGTTEVLEGDWKPRRLVIIEFPSVQRAKEWWTSPDYSKAKALRLGAAQARIVLAEGL